MDSTIARLSKEKKELQKLIADKEREITELKEQLEQLQKHNKQIVEGYERKARMHKCSQHVVSLSDKIVLEGFE